MKGRTAAVGRRAATKACAATQFCSYGETAAETMLDHGRGHRGRVPMKLY